MPLRDVVKVSRKTFINPSAWFNYDNFRYFNQTLRDILSTLFRVPKPEKQETFENAMVRLNLTEADVRNIAQNYRIYAYMFLAIGIVVVLYAFYLLFRYHNLIALILGLAAAGLFFAQSFKYDFWSLQMRKRKLGLTYKDWKKEVFGSQPRSS